MTGGGSSPAQPAVSEWSTIPTRREWHRQGGRERPALAHRPATSQALSPSARGRRYRMAYPIRSGLRSDWSAAARPASRTSDRASRRGSLIGPRPRRMTSTRLATARLPAWASLILSCSRGSCPASWRMSHVASSTLSRARLTATLRARASAVIRTRSRSRPRMGGRARRREGDPPMAGAYGQGRPPGTRSPARRLQDRCRGVTRLTRTRHRQRLDGDAQPPGQRHAGDGRQRRQRSGPTSTRRDSHRLGAGDGAAPAPAARDAGRGQTGPRGEARQAWRWHPWCERCRGCVSPVSTSCEQAVAGQPAGRATHRPRRTWGACEDRRHPTWPAGRPTIYAGTRPVIPAGSSPTRGTPHDPCAATCAQDHRPRRA